VKQDFILDILFIVVILSLTTLLKCGNKGDKREFSMNYDFVFVRFIHKVRNQMFRI